MKAEIAGEDPTPLEALLSERIVSCWMLTTLSEGLMWPDSSSAVKPAV